LILFVEAHETDAPAVERHEALSSSPAPNSKMSEPSRKKVRFSGKKISKRVRLICRTSTSVSAKSVFTVNAASSSTSPLRHVQGDVGIEVGFLPGPAMRWPRTRADRQAGP
jgi:hypothetical protein